MSDDEDRLDFGEDDDCESVISLGVDAQQQSQQQQSTSEDEEPSASAAADAQIDEVTTEALAHVEKALSATAAGSSVQLPDGWIECKSKSSGSTYYLNNVDKSTTWDVPQQPASAVAAPPETSQLNAKADRKVDDELSSEMSRMHSQSTHPLPTSAVELGVASAARSNGHVDPQHRTFRENSADLRPSLEHLRTVSTSHNSGVDQRLADRPPLSAPATTPRRNRYASGTEDNTGQGHQTLMRKGPPLSAVAATSTQVESASLRLLTNRAREVAARLSAAGDPGHRVDPALEAAIPNSAAVSGMTSRAAIVPKSTPRNATNVATAARPDSDKPRDAREVASSLARRRIVADKATTSSSSQPSFHADTTPRSAREVADRVQRRQVPSNNDALDANESFGSRARPRSPTGSRFGAIGDGRPSMRQWQVKPVLQQGDGPSESRDVIYTIVDPSTASKATSSAALIEHSLGAKRQRYSPRSAYPSGMPELNSGDGADVPLTASANKRARTEADAPDITSLVAASVPVTEPPKTRRINILGKGKGRSASSTPIENGHDSLSNRPLVRQHVEDDMQLDNRTPNQPIDSRAEQHPQRTVPAELSQTSLTDGSLVSQQNGYGASASAKPHIILSGLSGINGLPPRPNFAVPDLAGRGHAAPRDSRSSMRQTIASGHREHRDIEFNNDGRSARRRSPPADDRRPSSAFADRFQPPHFEEAYASQPRSAGPEPSRRVPPARRHPSDQRQRGPLVQSGRGR